MFLRVHGGLTVPHDLANRALDCVIGGCAALWGVWIGEHWMTMLGGALVLWRAVQAFVLEPMGIFWPRPRARRGLRR